MENKNDTRSNQKLTLGLALSGGGARGLAHIGALKVLEEADIKIDFLAGTSMGGVIAAVYATGMSPTEIESIAKEYAETRKLLRLADPALPRKGLFQGEHLRSFFKKHIGECTFADLLIPLTLVAVDLNTGKEVYINEGSVAEAVRATVSVPGLLAPVEHNGQRLVDGGLLNNIPVDVVRLMGADKVLAVDVHSNDGGDSFWYTLGQKRFITNTFGGLIAVLGDSLDLLVRQQAIHKLQQFPPDFIVRPNIPNGVTIISGYNQAEELITKGMESIRPLIPDLRQTLYLP
ncbi:MAG: patatin-like phospholipase family protein [Anaerolineales bacterium]|nr:patatin-like phospholipase family protein [Anaerolineales bacterium]